MMNLLKFAAVPFLTFVPHFVFAAMMGAATATYEVPVPENLKQFAQFSMNEPLIAQENGKTRIHYRLPAALVGPAHPGVTMYSEGYGSDRFKFESENGEALCEKSGIIQCSVKYRNLDVDLNQVRQFLLRHTKSKAEFEGRFQVASMFLADPGGILKYHQQAR